MSAARPVGRAVYRCPEGAARPITVGMTPRKVLFYIGWVLLLAAFFAGAAEALVHADPSRPWGLVSAHDLWYTLWPGNLVIAEIRIEKLSPALWEGVVRPLLEWPAWVLSGLPGGALAWFCRPIRTLTADEERDLLERREALFLYDELSEQAVADGYGDGDDMEPDHGHHHLLEEDGVTLPDGEQDFDIDMNNLPPPPGGDR